MRPRSSGRPTTAPLHPPRPRLPSEMTHGPMSVDHEDVPAGRPQLSIHLATNSKGRTMIAFNVKHVPEMPAAHPSMRHLQGAPGVEVPALRRPDFAQRLERSVRLPRLELLLFQLPAWSALAARCKRSFASLSMSKATRGCLPKTRWAGVNPDL